MRFCRFNHDRLGIVEDGVLYDVSPALAAIPPAGWPLPPGDPLIANLAAVRAEAEKLKASAQVVNFKDVTLNSPVANPGKIMAAPANYRLHVEIDAKDPGVDLGVHHKQLAAMSAPAEELGLFLKAHSSLVGPSEGVTIAFPARRNDHEVELAVVIGHVAKNIRQREAMDVVAGYCIGLDMTVRGIEDRSFRKSPDSYTVLGPWLVTSDELRNPHELNFGLTVNGQARQKSNTAALTVGIARMIEKASEMYTLYAGDVLLTGTPEGVGEVKAGDTMSAWCDGIGEMSVSVL